MFFVIFSSFLLTFSLFFFQFDYCVSQFDYYVSYYVPSWLILNRSLDFLDLDDCSFPMLSNFSATLSSNIFTGLSLSLLLLGPPIISFSSPFGTPNNVNVTVFDVSEVS